ncbi:MAG: tRNA lysidine(34) synthetase TilS [Clostridia bacterium]|nr:tRNA lysidine(34) synthetase TilS [Clostridia bacterium]
MFVDLLGISPKETVAVAVSGGQDSMALLHILRREKEKFHFNVIAINVEHGIRGKASVSDSEFVALYCKNNGVPLLSFKVDALSYAKKNKLSVETAARILRYGCFLDAIAKGKCDKVATAHHKKDNFETVLFNLFRGTGIKGLAGIKDGYDGRIIRPLLKTDKSEIEKYVKENELPFVTDETNFSTDYTRNALRLNVIPKIEELFPDAENAVLRLSESAKLDEEFLSAEADKILSVFSDRVEIKIPAHYSVFARATVKALKSLGVKKDWEKVHIDDAYALTVKQNGASVDLLGGVTVCREYDKLTFTKTETENKPEFPFSLGTFEFFGTNYKAEITAAENLKDGLYIDADKLPKDAVIRTKKDGDRFTKFGGGTKSLGDYFTDIKVPKRLRDKIPVIASGNEVFAIFKLAVSDKVRIDGNTRRIIKLTQE